MSEEEEIDDKPEDDETEEISDDDAPSGCIICEKNLDPGVTYDDLDEPGKVPDRRLCRTCNLTEAGIPLPSRCAECCDTLGDDAYSSRDDPSESLCRDCYLKQEAL